MNQLLKRISPQKLGIVLGVAVAGFLTLLALPSQSVHAADFSDNAIIRGGASSPQDLVNKVRANATGDLPSIMDLYGGLKPAEYDAFVKKARAGVAYKDGTIVVDGRTVMTGAYSLGRSQKSYSRVAWVNNVPFHESRSQDVFRSNAIPVMVFFDERGMFKSAIMYDCGNPMRGTPNNPNFGCHNINIREVDRTTRCVSSNATAGNGASIREIVYDFGDGTRKSGGTNPSTNVCHTYNKPGSYVVKVDVSFNVPGGQVYGIHGSGNCATVVEIKPEVKYSCDALNMTARKGTDDTYDFTSKVSMSGGSKLTKLTYDLGDGKKYELTNPSQVVSHKYTKNGTFTAKVTATFTLPDGKTVTAGGSGNCAKRLTVKPVYACTVLQASTLNDQKTKFRFTAKYTQRRAEIKKATFVLDNKTSFEVAPANGVLSKDFEFTDGAKHTVVATLSFDIGSTTQTTKCSASVTATKPPVCPIPGKENLPPNSPQCFEPCPNKPSVPIGSPECFEPCPANPNVPIGSPECVTPVTPVTPELPKTGPGEVAGMFAGLAVLGAGAHYVLRRRSDRLHGLAAAAVADDPSALNSFIAQNHPNAEETAMAKREYNHLHPEASSRTSHHRLIQKHHGHQAPGNVIKPEDK